MIMKQHAHLQLEHIQLQLHVSAKIYEAAAAALSCTHNAMHIYMYALASWSYKCAIDNFSNNVHADKSIRLKLSACLPYTY